MKGFVTCVILSLLLSSVLAHADTNWDKNDGRGVATAAADLTTTTLALGEDEEVVLEYEGVPVQRMAINDLGGESGSGGGGGGEVPPGGYTQNNNQCEFSCEYFYNRSPDDPVCIQCSSLYHYTLAGTGRSTCYSYPTDFNNGQVTQEMVNNVYSYCSNNCQCPSGSPPRVRNLGLYDKIEPV